MKVINNQSGANVQSLNTRKTGAKGLDESLKGTGKNASIISDEMLASSAKVEVSPRGKEINRVKSLAKEGPDVDEAKVRKFQDLIDKGLYNVDAGAVADRLVNEHVMNAMADGDDE